MKYKSDPPRASIVMAPICSRCRSMIEAPVYVEECMEGGNILQKEEFYMRAIPEIRPGRCRKCGAEFRRIVGPKDVHIPYDVDYALDKESEENND